MVWPTDLFFVVNYGELVASVTRYNLLICSTLELLIAKSQISVITNCIYPAFLTQHVITNCYLLY